ncbi:response regulator [Gloeocapsopsis dulcis]|uniref:Circadian input-output histidine kinase CikA n=1 Tax=Gloeocapsopsis dulcis AAB1 = 1H9 TaxID=1433147 RepID=A0A6N8G114_9CHRO|nr:response regulator [Gloeocapsopsis dulcis]MUL38275.1 hybrid sensor histidine kinase/response regulator [Gloeocapsopsis dulcis AAB1 = 1H9]WNN89335.1 response regulator [Gloeocapsopsis dulcis]
MNQPLCILLVDDNPDDRLLLCHELEQEFPDLKVQEILEAKGLEQALVAGEFDLAITDYQLNWTDGIQILEAIKSRDSFCPVVMFTGTGNEEIAVKAMKAGLDDYLLKAPSRYPRIRAAVRLALERAETRRALARAQAEQVELLQREQAARAEAEAANRLKDEFLATLSHELRTPLNAMMGWTQLMVTQRLNEQTFNRAAEVIHRNTRMLAQLIEDLLDVSCAITGKLQLNSHPTELIPAIKAAIDTVQATAIAKRIHLSSRLDASVGMILGDASRLQQVVWNLLINAIKFTPEGGRVEVRLEQVEEAGAESQKLADNLTAIPDSAYAQITVSDTGKGISSDVLPFIFERFRQADGSTTRKYGGLGLGLAIVRNLVELHGGSVYAESQGEGQGTTFTVKFPLMETNPAVEQKLTPLEEPLNLSGVQILVVDDELDTLELIGFVLGQAGATVTKASSAQAALEAFRQLRPSILVCDIAMPEMDGYMLIQQIRTMPNLGQVLAIALTAYARKLDQQQAIAAGFQQHLAKPVEPEVLVREIANLLKHN